VDDTHVICPFCGDRGEFSSILDEKIPGSTADSDKLRHDVALQVPSSGARTPTLGADGSLGTAGHIPYIPGYEILGELGRGGMGIVYKARQTGLKRIVALKMILAGSHADAKDVARFRIEAEAVARLRHPNIVQIYEIGESEGVPFFSLEFADGGCLKDALDGTPQAHEEAARTIRILATAMQCAHESGIVHRDLKPGNILLMSNGAGSGERLVADHGSIPDTSRHSPPTTHPLTTHQSRRTVPKISDFGLAKPLESDTGLTESGIAVGTPSYMAPEQAEGKGTGPAVDVYALGAILYEMLTGRPPFRANNRLDTVLQVINDDPVPPRRLQSKVPVDLETICLKCLEKDATKRYASAGHLADDLHRYLANEPINARPIGAGRRVLKWARRRPALAALVSVSVLALLVLAGVIEHSTIRLKEERDFALEQRRIADDQRDVADRARQDAERQHQRAQVNFERARQAVDQMLTRVGDEKLKNVPLLEELQRELLEDALKFNKQFLEDYGDDPAVRAEVARAYFRAATIRGMLGKHDEAVTGFRAAIEIQRRLADEAPAEPAFRKELAQSFQVLTVHLQEMRAFVDAERAVNEAIALLEALVAQDPTVESYRRDLAISHNRKGLLLPSTARWDEVEPEYRKALELLEPLAAKHPNNVSYRRDLTWTLENLGAFLGMKSRNREAEKTLSNAIQRLESLVHDFPKEMEYRQRLAKTLSNLGAVFGSDKRLKEAEAAFLRTIEIDKSLVQDSPRVPAYRRSLAQAYTNLAMVLDSDGRTAESIEPRREALHLYEELAGEVPTIPDDRRAVAEALNITGSVLFQTGQKSAAEEMYRKSISIMEKLAAEFPDERHYNSELGRVLNNLAESLRGRNQLNEARQLIERAIHHQEAAYRSPPSRERYAVLLRRHLDELAEIHLKGQDYLSAIKVADDLSRRFPNSFEAQYDAGCIFSRAVPLAASDKQLPESKREQTARSYGDQAVSRLQAAVEKGFTNVGHMKKDTDLDALRHRTDFQTVVTELEKKRKTDSTVKKP
jgi:serine/threonine-protein kinase